MLEQLNTVMEDVWNAFFYAILFALIAWVASVTINQVVAVANESRAMALQQSTLQLCNDALEEVRAKGFQTGLCSFSLKDNNGGSEVYMYAQGVLLPGCYLRGNIRLGRSLDGDWGLETGLGNHASDQESGFRQLFTSVADMNEYWCLSRGGG